MYAPSRTTTPILTLHTGVGVAATGHSTPPGPSASCLNTTRAPEEGCSDCQADSKVFGGLFNSMAHAGVTLPVTVQGEVLNITNSKDGDYLGQIVYTLCSNSDFAHMRNMRPDYCLDFPSWSIRAPPPSLPPHGCSTGAVRAGTGGL